MSLVFTDSPPKDLRNHSSTLTELLTEKGEGLITGIEKFSTRKILSENGTIIDEPRSTDVWFYVIDPSSETILLRNSSEIGEKFLKPSIQSQINFAASGLVRATAQGIYAPLEEPKSHLHKVKTAIAVNPDVFSFALIAIAVIILIIGTFGIIYICVSWSKYKNFKQRMRQYSAPASPVRYDPVILGSQNGGIGSQRGDGGDTQTTASLKEYETQVC